jgi:hypothetical protein
MRKRKVEEVAEVIKELDEESLKELFELLKKELEPEAEIEPGALREKPQEAVVQEVTKAPTSVQEAPTITLGVLAKYPARMSPQPGVGVSGVGRHPDPLRPVLLRPAGDVPAGPNVEVRQEQNDLRDSSAHHGQRYLLEDC